MMTPELATLEFVVPEPFGKATKLIRRTLTEAGISITMELDASGRIRRELGVELAACRILCVDHPFFLLEAMALGRSIVSTAVGGTTDVVVDGVTGYLVPSRDPQALAERVLQLLADPVRRGSGGRAPGPPGPRPSGRDRPPMTG